MREWGLVNRLWLLSWLCHTPLSLDRLWKCDVCVQVRCHVSMACHDDEGGQCGGWVGGGGEPNPAAPFIDGPVTVISILITMWHSGTLWRAHISHTKCQAVMKVDMTETGNSLSHTHTKKNQCKKRRGPTLLCCICVGVLFTPRVMSPAQPYIGANSCFCPLFFIIIIIFVSLCSFYCSPSP